MPKPPLNIQKHAREGLEMRRNSPKSKKGGTAVGVARARNLANGDNIPLETLKRISQFARHLENYRPEIKVKGLDGSNVGTRGTQAVKLWGGPGAPSWAKKQINIIENKKKK